MNIFGWALLIKYLWRALFGSGIWQDIIKHMSLRKSACETSSKKEILVSERDPTYGEVFIR